MSGVLFDLPHVVDGARKLLDDAGLSARCEVLCGDFFTSGRERTEREFADLFAKAGLSLKRVLPTQSPYSLLEALRVFRPVSAPPLRPRLLTSSVGPAQC